MGGPKHAVGVFTRGDGVTIYVIPKHEEDIDDAIKRVAGKHGFDASQVQRIEGQYSLTRGATPESVDPVAEIEPAQEGF